MNIGIKLIIIIFVLPYMLFSQRGARIAYIDMDIILKNNKEFNTANQLLEKKIFNWKKEIELKKIKLQEIQSQFSVERILLTPELINDRELEIRDFASGIIQLQEKRFGINGDMMIQKNKLLRPIQDQVMAIVQDIAKERKYDFIFDRSSDIIMLYSAKNYDISDLVLKRIQVKERIKERKEKINSFQN